MKRLNYVMFAAITFVCAALFASCSSDEDFHFETNDEFTTTGIQMDATGGMFEIPVKSSGEYTISRESNINWIQAKASGSSVKGQIWPNYGDVARESKIVLENNGHKLTIPILQNASDDGKNATTYKFIDVAGNKGIGCGLNIESLEQMPTPVVNIMALDSLMDSNKLIKSLYRQNPLDKRNYNDANLDSIEIKRDTLGINATVDISYGLFHLNIEGSYVSRESKIDTSKIVRTAGNYPLLQSSLDVKSLISRVKKYLAKSDKDKSGESEYMEYVINEEFLNSIDSIKKQIANNDSTTYKAAVKDLVTSYGAVITTGATLGGKINLSCICGSSSMADTMKIDGKVSVAAKSGLLSLDANVEAGYSKVALTLLKGSKVYATFFGGTSKEISNLYNAFVYEKDTLSLKKAKTAWIDSVIADDDAFTNTADVLSFSYLPIWAFFDSRSKEKVQAVVLEMYKNSPALPLLRDHSNFVSND